MPGYTVVYVYSWAMVAQHPGSAIKVQNPAQLPKGEVREILPNESKYSLIPTYKQNLRLAGLFCLTSNIIIENKPPRGYLCLSTE